MNQFEGVTVTTQANVYFDGKVTSRAIHFPDGEMKTLGIIQPGDYEFGTEKKEIMEMLQGEAYVMLAGETSWTKYEAGSQFEVPANSSFKIRCENLVDYCCSYIG
jgi:purine/pyrimidine-nucleoside phosphorylase